VTIKAMAWALIGLLSLGSFALTGCVSDPYGRPVVSQNQAIGAVAGGLAGAAIGNKVGSRSKETGNTILGGAAGALLGGWLGGQLDRPYDRPYYNGRRY
jgi:uncharacterized protein YcfJ